MNSEEIICLISDRPFTEIGQQNSKLNFLLEIESRAGLRWARFKAYTKQGSASKRPKPTYFFHELARLLQKFLTKGSEKWERASVGSSSLR